MTHSALTNQIRISFQQSSRNGVRVDTVLIHHQAGFNDDATINLMVTGRKTVSANYTISNEGRITLVVDEDNRAWTSGSSTDGGRGASWDRRAITIEIENESGAPDWKISSAALNSMAALLQDLRSRYRIDNVLGHRDLWAKFRASYPTFCPGPHTVSLVLGLAGGASIPATLPGQNYTPIPASTSVDFHYGLSSRAMLVMQQALARLGRYAGSQDGYFGLQSVMAMQKWLRDNGLLASDYRLDGIPGALYGEALHDLADRHGYTGTHVGLPGSNVSAALQNWAATIAPTVQQELPQFAEGREWSYWEPTGSLAARVQRALSGMGRYNFPDGSPRPADGVFGENTRKGVQTTLNVSGMFVGRVDGIIEGGGSLGIQKYAKAYGDYKGDLDGAPREMSWAGLALGLERG